MKKLFLLLLFFWSSSCLLYSQNKGKVHQLDSVVVSASAKRALKQTQLSAVALPASAVFAMPATLGETDVLKSLQMLPGVQGGGDGNVSLYIRGGASSQNLYLVDGAPLYNPEHFKGYVSAINPIAVSDLILYKGGFPAQFGNRLSGIVDVALKRGDFNNWHGAVNVGLLSASAMVEGPIIKDKLSVSVSARRSFYQEITSKIADWLYDKADENDDGVQYNFPFKKVSFYDLNAKLSYKPNACNMIDLSFYKGRDINKLNDLKSVNKTVSDDRLSSRESIYIENSSEKWGNLLLSANWIYSKGIIESNNNLAYSSYFFDEQYYYRTEDNAYSEPDHIQTLGDIRTWTSQYKSAIDKMQFSSINKIEKGIAKGLEFGFDAGYAVYHPHYGSTDKFENLFGESKESVSFKGGKRNMISTGIFAAYNFSIGSLAQVDIGIRGSAYFVEGKAYLYPEPRVNVAMDITDKLSLKASYSIISQAEHRVSTADLIEDSDVWVPAGREIKPSVSSQVAAGVFYDFKDKKGLSISLEGYYKNMTDILEYKDISFSAFSAEEWEESVAVGKGWAYGAEFLLRKDKGKTTGWLSYTWSKSLEKFDRENQVLNYGNAFYAPHDCRNSITLNITQKIGKNLDFSATFSYHTGRYRTMYNLDININEMRPHANDGGIIPLHLLWYSYRSKLISERNNVKLADYHKLDVAFNYRIVHNTGKSTINVGITNLYNNYNISFIRGGDPLTRICMFPIMPSLSYSYNF